MRKKDNKNGIFKIKPAGKHLLTIGGELIKDRHAAIVELVKNSYDADASKVEIIFSGIEKGAKKSLKIEIKDDGCGMSFKDVTEKWMVPSTDNKLKSRKSAKGRVMQGKKGIGRYSSSILGEDLLLESVKNNNLTYLYLVWDEFNNARYLNDVDILVETKKTINKNGTSIIVTGGTNFLNEWTKLEIDKLRSELKKLISPISFSKKDKFNIELAFNNFPVDEYYSFQEKIEPYPLYELYDYRISGTVTKDGIANLKYYNNKEIKLTKEDIEPFKILIDNRENSYCGNLKFDFRVYDRDKRSIDNLIQRGIKDPATKKYISNVTARQLLNEYNGIGVYRHGFRIRPLGEPGFDWLSLDRKRVQKPTFFIGSNQIIGHIDIEDEVKSGLIEKSARDGLRDDNAYKGLQEVSRIVLSRLEEKRYDYRRRAGYESGGNVSDNIQKLFEFDDLKNSVTKILEKYKVSKDDSGKIIGLIDKKEKTGNKIAENIKKTVAIYEGQVTLGKILNVVLHEGRKPLAYFKNQIPNLIIWRNELVKNYSKEIFDKVISRLETLKEQAQVFVDLFAKLDPLAAKKRIKKEKFFISHVIDDVFGVYEKELKKYNIEKIITINDEQKLEGWKSDYYIALTNLVDNSVYWFGAIKGNKNKTINIDVQFEKKNIIINYSDNGVGIEKELIESEIIFEPGFSRKIGGGTGLGLSIAGEAMKRNNGTLRAVYSKNGAKFIIEISKKLWTK